MNIKGTTTLALMCHKPSLSQLPSEIIYLADAATALEIPAETGLAAEAAVAPPESSRTAVDMASAENGVVDPAN